MGSQINQGPPYQPTTWALGGQATKNVDIPITAIFMALYMGSAAWHMTIFQKNNKRGHKFLFCAALFVFSISRIVTCTLRIASICIPTNIDLSIAAAVFVGAGVLFIFVINPLWSQRILRSLHPTIGWHRGTKVFFMTLYVIIGLTLAMNITATVQNYFTLRPRTKFIDHAVTLYALTFLAIVSSLPYLVIGLALALPRRSTPEKFGAGKLSTKIAILLVGTFLVSLGAWYRCATSWERPVPRTQPLPAYFAKPCFYIFNFSVEVLTVYMYAVVRVDLRFHVPNGAKGPGSYEPIGTEGNGNKEGKATTIEALQKKQEV